MPSFGRVDEVSRHLPPPSVPYLGSFGSGCPSVEPAGIMVCYLGFYLGLGILQLSLQEL